MKVRVRLAMDFSVPDGTNMASMARALQDVCRDSCCPALEVTVENHSEQRIPYVTLWGDSLVSGAANQAWYKTGT